MTPSKLRKQLEDLKEYINYSEIARQSEGSKQELNYWLKHSAERSSFSPEPGLQVLKTLCEDILDASTISEAQFKRWKKMVNMSAISKEFFGAISSTVAVTMSRKGINHYQTEICTASRFILSKLKTSNVKVRKKVKIKKRKVGIKLKKQ